jgi:hypothetical protein
MNSTNHSTPRYTYRATLQLLLNKPPRPRLSKERGHFVNAAATPPWAKEGSHTLPAIAAKKAKL